MGVGFDFAAWEKNWVESEGCSSQTPPADVVNTARSLMDYAAFITPSLIPNAKKGELGTWTVAPEKVETLSFRIPADKLNKLSAILLEKKGGKSSAVCSNMKLVADGKVLIDDVSDKALHNDNLRTVYKVTLPDDIRGNNGVELQLRIKNTGLETASGQVSLIGE